MQREILFRGKSIETGEWIYGSLIGNDVIVGKIVEFEEDYFCTESWNKVDPETVGQFIEKNDKNGVKIFEGDILKSLLGNIFIVYFGTLEKLSESKEAKKLGYKYDSFKCTGWLARNIKTGHLDFLDSSLITGEIIGNIHDNPELL